MIKHLISLSLTGILLAGGCASYKMEVQQGNYITRDELAMVKPGMSAGQVREILGTPLLIDDFHKDRWDYVFYLRNQGDGTKRNNVTVFFQNGVVRDVRQSEALVEIKPG